MKNIYKYSALVAATLLLGACSSSEEAGSADEPVTIEYWHGNAETQGGQAVAELVDKFNESQEKVVVEPVFNEGLYVGLMQNLQTQVAGGQYPALVQIGWTYREYFDANFDYQDPQTLIEKVGDASEQDYLKEKFPQEMLQLATNFQGDQLGFPYSVSTAVVFVNTEAMDEAGIDYSTIETYDDLYKAAQEYTEVTGDYGLYISLSNDNWTTQQLVESYGAETITAEGEAAFAEEPGVQAVQGWANGIEEGYIMHDNTDAGHQAFISGDIAMVNTTIAQRGNITSNADFEAVAIELPYQANNGTERAVPAGGAMLAVTAEDETEQAATWEFIKFLYEPENIAIWTEDTGYLPPTSDATENQELADLIENDQMFQTSYAQMEDLVPFASFPGSNGLQAADTYRDMRDRIFQGTPAAEEMPKTEDEINEMIQ